MPKYIFALLLIACSVGATVNAQTQAQRTSAWRYEIDAKRMVTDVLSEEALPRSREFIRIDSSYYVGWMYEGIYKATHAADYMGYKNAIAPLERALDNLQRDYQKELKVRTSDLMVFYPIYKYHIDYSQIAYYLYTCYSNIEDADAAYGLQRRIIAMNFQKDYYIDPYNHLGWLVHRNRFYTNKKYAFLENSIDDNEGLAHLYLDSGMARIYKNYSLNEPLFGSGYEKMEKLSVYHYKSILYSYEQKIDSAEHYYGLMKNSSVFPHNNYASLKMVEGEFAKAEQEYKAASVQESGDKRLQEWAYFGSIVNIYKGETDKAEQEMKSMIKSNGSTPGFGWYNIALARALLYDGRVEESGVYLNKAAEFKELHIGTTLGQSHYDFAIQIQKLVALEMRYQLLLFEHTDYWYNPLVWWSLLKTKAETWLQRFVLINQFAQNPERNQVVYKLFSTESVVTWSEIWYLIKNFSTSYFIKKFEAEAQTDKRPFIKKYFKLMVAKLWMQKGKYEQAENILLEILRSPDTEKNFEKLFSGKVLDAYAQCLKKRDKDAEADAALNQLYDTYPQLVPFSGMAMKMNLVVQGAQVKDIIEAMKNYNVQWQNQTGKWPNAYVEFYTSKGVRYIKYRVSDSGGNELLSATTFSYTKATTAARQLVLGLFQIGKTNMVAEDEDKETGSNEVVSK